MYSLALRGTRLLDDKPLFYPLPKKVSVWQYPHLLLTNEVLICAVKLAQEFPDITLSEIKHDFSLRTLMKEVVPDGWIDLRKEHEQIPIWFEISIEIREKKFKEKIENILLSVKREYQEVLGTEYVTVSFLTPKETQVATMIRWTEEILVALNETREADLFRFAHIPEKDIDPVELFTKPIHQWLGSKGAVTSLI